MDTSKSTTRPDNNAEDSFSSGLSDSQATTSPNAPLASNSFAWADAGNDAPVSGLGSTMLLETLPVPAVSLAEYPPLKRRISPNVIWLTLSGSVMLIFLLVPIIALVVRSFTNGALGSFLNSPTVVEALQLSLITTGITLALAVVFGTPLAYLLARYRFPGYGLIDTFLDLPIVLPPAVAGIALLLTLGRRGWVGAWLDQQFGITIGFTTVAVVLAQLFVAAPFYIKAAKAGFESVDRNLENIASSLGSRSLRTFWKITVPLSLPALLGGIVMTWARALGEFGATIMFAGNFEGRTQTMPLAIYASFDSAGGLDEAVTLSVILVVVSFAVLLIFKGLSRFGARAWSKLEQVNILGKSQETTLK